MDLKFYTTPWKHQVEAIEYFMPRNYGALYTDMGTGKTKIMIDLIVNKRFKRAVIVAPKKVCRVWETEFSKHMSPDALYCVLNLSDLSGSNKIDTVKKMSQNAIYEVEILVVNYDSIWREPFKSFLLKSYKADAVICDESHRIKSPSSKCSRFLHLLGKNTRNRYLMTGTPLAQSPLDIYAQYRFLEPSIFGTNFNIFKNTYGNWIHTKGGYSILDKINPYKNLDELHSKMFSCAFKAESGVVLPDTQDIIIEYDLPKDTEKYYREIQKEGCLELKQGVVETSNVVSIVTKLQQIMSGYLPLNNNGTKILQALDTARQETLEELLEGIKEPVVIFAKYTQDIKNIHKVCQKLDYTISELSGNNDNIKDWMDGNTQVLVIQINSGAEGLTLTRARYCIYYTLSYSLTKYLQSRKRVHRPGQTRPVIYYTIVGKLKKGTSIDERILDSLKNNKNLIDSILTKKIV